jgi:hypothetical protein
MDAHFWCMESVVRWVWNGLRRHWDCIMVASYIGEVGGGADVM